MERGRKTKVLTIIALVVAIVTMSLGFAVFSNILTISSSATVKPNAEDYIVTIYGAVEEPKDVLNSDDLSALVPYFTSRTTSIPCFNTGFSASSAIIDNRNFTISNINVTFSSAGQQVVYVFLIKNEGKNDIYFDLSSSHVDGLAVCTAKDETKQALVDEYCDNVIIWPTVVDSSSNAMLNEAVYRIEPNDYFFVLFLMASGREIGDEEFDVKFGDLKLFFSSVDNSQNG